MTSLADQVLPLIRTRADLHRWHAANAHGTQMHEAVDVLEMALPETDPSEAFSVAQKALSSALRVIAHADDSSGIIGDACRRLIELHPQLAWRAGTPVTRLVKWMLDFQFNNDIDYFELDPVAYAPALGANGMQTYRQHLADMRETLGPRPKEDERWRSTHSHEWFTLDWNERRLAVLDRDVEAIIRTHFRDGRVAAWAVDTARAFVEIDETELAIEWARRGMDIGPSHQSLKAAEYWCSMLAEHHPEQSVEANILVFRRWPSSSSAAGLSDAAGSRWPEFQDEVLTTLRNQPRDAVYFAQSTLKDIPLAWRLAAELALDDARTWSDLLKAYERVDPLATLPRHEQLVRGDLTEADANRYRLGARRLAKMRKIAAGSDEQPNVEALIAELRETHRRRPRLQAEFSRAGLP